jgi:hypothetical protein
MQATQEQIIHDQVAGKAKQAVAVASATGSVAKTAFLATLNGAKTTGDKCVVFGALAGFIAFFLPWASILGTISASGFRAATDASSVFWLHPLTMAACFFLSSANKTAAPQKRILAARWYIVIGTLWFGPGVAAVCNAFSGAVAFGGYLATASAGAILIGGILQISERLSELAETA